MYFPRFPRASDVERPDVQAIRLFAVQLQAFEAFLNPLPVLDLILFGEGRDFRMLLRVALEYSRADQAKGILNGMYQGLGVIDDQFSAQHAGSQPLCEMLA